MKNVLVVAGEASGELYGAELVRELRARTDNLAFWGAGGERMEKEGVEILFPIRDFSVLGFSEVALRVPFFLRALSRMRKEIRRRRPAAVVLIDFPGFNLRLARAAASESVPVVYYVAPQAWAWGAGRVRALRELVRVLLVILPFEETFFRARGVPVRFVGHPLVDLARPSGTPGEFRERREILESQTIIGLFPGSRAHEVERLLPVMTRTIRRLADEGFPVAPLIGAAPTLDDVVYRRSDAGQTPLLRGETYDLLAASGFALVASGTMTVEAVCVGTPMAVLYRVSPISWMIGKRLVRVPHVGMVNLLAGERLAPEFLQGDAAPDRLLPVAREWLLHPERLEAMRARIRAVKETLGEGGASGRAAEEVLRILE
ncbi:MAG: lipid-A-disaccharide synthase [Candidatus Eisenbacteria bacterium]|nr:lipid-A-disaccharide synthase [Candidatus Eisenbacteria bacterium]